MGLKQKTIRIGTRGSPLALKQTQMVVEALAHVQPDLKTEIVVIKTSGDWTPEQGEARLDERQGGKALFAKEIEEALLAGRIDAAVHSMKDMDSHLPEELTIECMLPREDARDVVIFKGGATSLEELPKGAIIGTCSLRRQAFLNARRPDLKIMAIRGNVQTRLQKLKDGNFDGIMLAYAGLKRLGLEREVSFFLEPEDMLPCAGQGAVGIEISKSCPDILSIFGQINHAETLMKVQCERAALAALGGSCRTPVGAYAILEKNEIYLRVNLISLDGQMSYFEEGRASLSEGQKLGQELGLKIKAKAPPELLS